MGNSTTAGPRGWLRKGSFPPTATTREQGSLVPSPEAELAQGHFPWVSMQKGCGEFPKAGRWMRFRALRQGMG